VSVILWVRLTGSIGTACASELFGGGPRLEVVRVPVLSVHLQDGFDDDEVVVSVDDEVVRRLEHVTTRLLLGYAEILEIDVPHAKCRLSVAVPRRALRAEVTVDAVADVGVSVDVGGITLLVSDQPFGYA
jgi:hypothetical protein